MKIKGEACLKFEDKFCEMSKNICDSGNAELCGAISELCAAPFMDTASKLKIEGEVCIKLEEGLCESSKEICEMNDNPQLCDMLSKYC